jgi:hypothetical protein
MPSVAKALVETEGKLRRELDGLELPGLRQRAEAAGVQPALLRRALGQDEAVAAKAVLELVVRREARRSVVVAGLVSRCREAVLAEVARQRAARKLQIQHHAVLKEQVSLTFRSVYVT